MQKKNTVNAPQIVESQNASNDAAHTVSRTRSGKAAIYDGIAPELIAAGEQEAARRGVTLSELIADYLRAFTPARIAAEADRLNYRAVLRKLIASNTEDRREDAEICDDFARAGKPVSEERKHIGALLWRREWLLLALEECSPERLRFLLLVLRVPLTEDEKALLSFLSALWPEE